MNEVPIAAIGRDRIEAAVGSERMRKLEEHAESARRLFNGRVIWNINSTARGGGVAEMLQPLIGYARGLGVDVRWVVVEGDPEFFAVTKRIHNHLHGHPGDGGPLGDHERNRYEDTLSRNMQELAGVIRPGDIAVCHDPQTAGLIPELKKKDVLTVWRCHVGHDHPNEYVHRTWDFLLPYVSQADRYVFTRKTFIPKQLDNGNAVIVPPSIDPLSPKNQPMKPEVARSILTFTGLLEGRDLEADPVFEREDGSKSRVVHCADVIHLGRAPAPERRMVVQVSRWDRLKDPIGVLEGFADYLARDSASLVLAGPNVSAVADDPEGGAMLDQVFVAWRELPHEVRKHIHIVCLPMTDREENAAIVNALQRHATVIVQKSLFEGFGLTVTEAMWKGRPVIASAVGGIQDQIVDGEHGLLVKDPADLHEFAHLVQRLLDDDDLARKLGENARARVEEQFLFTRHLFQYFELLRDMLS
jgi:trehalose synthase